MNIERLIKARAYRILRRLTHYRRISDKVSGSPTYINEIPLQTNEELIGIYENFLGERKENVVITTLGLHIFTEDKWIFTSYEQMSYIETPLKEHSVEELVTHLHSGGVIKIPIKGSRDVWEFLRFLMRVTEDIKKRR